MADYDWDFTDYSIQCEICKQYDHKHLLACPRHSKHNIWIRGITPVATPHYNFCGGCGAVIASIELHEAACEPMRVEAAYRAEKVLEKDD